MIWSPKEGAVTGYLVDYYEDDCKLFMFDGTTLFDPSIVRKDKELNRMEEEGQRMKAERPQRTMYLTKLVAKKFAANQG